MGELREGIERGTQAPISLDTYLGSNTPTFGIDSYNRA